MIINKISDFIKYVLSYSTKKTIKEDIDCSKQEITLEQAEQLYQSEQKEDKINIAKRTLMTRLYAIEQEITVFENSFPDQFKKFMDKIELLRKNYISTLENMSTLTFDIDPEIDGVKLGEVVKLEKDVQKFIESEVKFSIICKKLQSLIIKLNILYNVSIFHSKECEKQKVISQIEHAIQVEKEVIQDFKQCDYIISDTQLKERIISLISYVDYEIFKTSIRNSNKTPEELAKSLVILDEFDEFDYVNVFKSFIKDEISDLGELLSLVSDNECRKVFNNKVTKILTDFTYSDAKNQIFDTAFWTNFLTLESSLLQLLKNSGVDPEKVKVRLIIRMDISMNEKDVIVLPITTAYLSLTSLLVETHDERIMLLLKLLNNISNDVTYKEIYFLLLLFDVVDMVESTSNELKRHIKKYLKKYPYSRKTIMEKKEYVINSSNKEYVAAFHLDDYEQQILKTLEGLSIDFNVKNNMLYINSFYFNGLQNVLNSLKSNTKNII